MTALLALPAVCWLWVVLAAPGTSLPDCPLDALMCQRLHAHRARLVATAVVVSALALLALILVRPSAIDAEAEALRQAHVPLAIPDTAELRGCFATAFVAPICWRRQPDGSWAVEGQLDGGMWVPAAPMGNGTWRVVGLVVEPGPYPDSDSAGA